ncbi:hypothetical protein [Desulfonema magnum]|uniref:Addiction module component n=1 Tax=Desulfonema magnum TaxID=45655 RepID=A0A975GMT0_9BACT|nr:hypothetical protein [Desulfonema magnum]QTA87042.1 Uncharacterized protein dnm_030690 [Desulfonema magnum]
METQFDNIERQALLLPPEAREMLAARLLHSLDNEPLKVRQKKSGSDFWEELTALRQIMKKEGIEITDADFKGLRL